MGAGEGNELQWDDDGGGNDKQGENDKEDKCPEWEAADFTTFTFLWSEFDCGVLPVTIHKVRGVGPSGEGLGALAASPITASVTWNGGGERG